MERPRDIPPSLPPIPVSRFLELRLAPTVDPATGRVRKIDLRRYRYDATLTTATATAVGFRLEVTALRRLAAALVSLADQLGQP
jgi:hypothetical protein